MNWDGHSLHYGPQICGTTLDEELEHSAKAFLSNYGGGADQESFLLLVLTQNGRIFFPSLASPLAFVECGVIDPEANWPDLAQNCAWFVLGTGFLTSLVPACAVASFPSGLGAEGITICSLYLKETNILGPLFPLFLTLFHTRT